MTLSTTTYLPSNLQRSAGKWQALNWRRIKTTTLLWEAMVSMSSVQKFRLVNFDSEQVWPTILWIVCTSTRPLDLSITARPWDTLSVDTQTLQIHGWDMSILHQICVSWIFWHLCWFSIVDSLLSPKNQASFVMHGLRTPRKDIVFTALPKI